MHICTLNIVQMHCINYKQHKLLTILFLSIVSRLSNWTRQVIKSDHHNSSPITVTGGGGGVAIEKGGGEFSGLYTKLYTKGRECNPPPCSRHLGQVV
jgi:hypothetical protein